MWGGGRGGPHPSDEVRPVIVQMRELVKEFTLDMAFDKITADIIRIELLKGNIQ